MSIIQTLHRKNILLTTTFSPIHSGSSIYDSEYNHDKNVEWNIEVVDKSTHYDRVISEKFSGAFLKKLSICKNMLASK